MPRPNILWILSDQHHAGCLGSAGHPDVRTPALDRLAAEGTRFTRAYCNSPICGPSRCSMITGCYPRTTGITGNSLRHLNLPNPNTLPTMLRQIGYQTALVGKSHMVGSWDRDGFDYTRYCDLTDAEGGDPLNVHYFRYLVENGLAGEYDLGNRLEGQSGFALERFVSRIPLEHNLETWTGNEAMTFLEQRDRARPFMMQLSFQRPHEPLCIPPECVGWYRPEDLTLPPGAQDFFERAFAGKPDYQRDYVTSGTRGYPYRPLDPDDLRGQLAYYYSLITLIDQQVGRVLDHLRANGEYDNTIVLYTADHGDFAGDHGLVLKNLGIYECIHRVPFILRIPGRIGGQVRDGIVELVDVYPTLLDAAEASEHVPPQVEGTSLVPQTLREMPGRAHTVCEWDFLAPQRRVLAVRDRRYRLVMPVTPDDIGELYDHESDPHEIHNLWLSENHTSVRLALTEVLLGEVSRWPRAWSFADDYTAKNLARETLAQQVQSGKRRWD